MDREELNDALAEFRAVSKAEGFEIEDFRLLDVFPGEKWDSYILYMDATWMRTYNRVDSLDILIEIMWRTTSLETRGAIHYLHVASSNGSEANQLRIA